MQCSSYFSWIHTIFLHIQRELWHNQTLNYRTSQSTDFICFYPAAGDAVCNCPPEISSSTQMQRAWPIISHSLSTTITALVRKAYELTGAAPATPGHPPKSPLKLHVSACYHCNKLCKVWVRFQKGILSINEQLLLIND